MVRYCAVVLVVGVIRGGDEWAGAYACGAVYLCRSQMDGLCWMVFCRLCDRWALLGFVRYRCCVHRKVLCSRVSVLCRTLDVWFL
jgi:hypothetical protein